MSWVLMQFSQSRIDGDYDEYFDTFEMFGRSRDSLWREMALRLAPITELSWNSFWVIYKLILFTRLARLQKEQPSHGSWSDKRKMLIIKCYVLVIFFVFRLYSKKAMNHKKRVYAENIFLLYLFFFSLSTTNFSTKALR